MGDDCWRLAAPQSAVAIERASPKAGDSIAGTLMAAIAADNASTAAIFWNRVF
jgi:hypothetical protein